MFLKLNVVGKNLKNGILEIKLYYVIITIKNVKNIKEYQIEYLKI